MRRLLDLPAPAKVNLMLHVVGRRDDGYHELQSLFVPIDWSDTLHIERRNDGHLSREDLHGTHALPADDLCLRAARALQRASGCALGAHIVLDKRLPQQAGLGGGSSDAATVLIALNRLWGLRWPRTRLAALATTLGADVPFFLGTGPAWVEGIGERLTPVAWPSQAIVVVKPPEGVATAAIFADPALPRNTPRTSWPEVQATWPSAPGALGGRNDLQASAVRACPAIGVALQRLAEAGLQPRMSGSGSAVFALLPDVAAQQAVAALTWPPGWCVHIGRTLPQLPLAQA